MYGRFVLRALAKFEVNPEIYEYNPHPTVAHNSNHTDEVILQYQGRCVQRWNID
jgi:hypothetical protein